jgi:glycosyltransferase involved in cell wall biosynthesis
MKLFDSTFILIPARNEAQSLPKLLQEIVKFSRNVVVVDNNSSDETFEIAQRYTNHVIKEKKVGYGNACLAGIKYISDLPNKPENICFFDGDGQSLVSDIIKVCKPVIKSEKIKYCQGSRLISNLSKNGITGSAYVANKVFSYIITKIWKQKITDLGPLRCIDLCLLNKIHMNSPTYAWTIEMNVKLSKLFESVLEVPVSYRKRFTGMSKISGNFSTALKASIIMTIKLVSISLFWRYKDERK